MKILSPDDTPITLGTGSDNRFTVINFNDGTTSRIPVNFLQDWLGARPPEGRLYIGRCTGFAIGSIAKYDSDNQCLRIGSFVSAGQRVRFVLNGEHNINTISTHQFLKERGLPFRPVRQSADTIIGNDVWLGDGVLILGGAHVEDGCVIGANAVLPKNFRTEPYAIYAGNPARFIKFRFVPEIIERLLKLKWHEQSIEWLEAHHEFFMFDLTRDKEKSLALLDRLLEQKENPKRPPPLQADIYIREILSGNDKVFIWGAGELTKRLLKNSALCSANIVAIIDSNATLSGSELKGVTIVSPKQFLTMNTLNIPIIVLSGQDDDILKTIDEMKLPNPVHSIY